MLLSLEKKKGLLGQPRCSAGAAEKGGLDRVYNHQTKKLLQYFNRWQLMYFPPNFRPGRDLLFKAPPFLKERDMLHKEHLPFTDSPAWFKDLVAENHPGALNLNLS